MAVLDIQRRGQQIGRIRLGEQVPVGDKGKTRPSKLSTFRFTTTNRRIADAIVDLFGGQVRPWEGQWEAITERSVIGVTIPPRDAVVSQWYEMWNKGGCLRRCSSQVEQISGKECMCPHAADPFDQEMVQAAAKERARLAKLNPPQACGLKTRISVMVPDLPGLGVFRLDTSSFYAAGEIGDQADLLQMARDRGIFLPAELRIEQRFRVANGKRTPYPVPVLEILNTFREIASGALAAGGIAAQLPPAPGEQRRALTSGQPSPAQPTVPAVVAGHVEPEPESWTAQQIADLAKEATTREQIEILVDAANASRVIDDSMTPDGQVWEDLRPFLQARWRELPHAVGGAA